MGPTISAAARRCVARSLFISLCLLIGVRGVFAHDTTHKITVPVQIRKVVGSAATYQIAFGCLPAGAVTGEVVACEIKLVPADSNANIRLELLDGGRRIPLAVHHENEAGVYGAEYRFPAAGRYEASVQVGQDPPVSFTIPVSSGLIERLRWLSLAALALLGVAWAIRRTIAAAGWTNRIAMARAAAYAVIAVLLVAASDRFIVPIVGRALLPVRSNADVDWGALDDEPQEHVETLSSSHASTLVSASAPDSSTAATDSIELTGQVVARPGAIVDVTVPVTGRVVFTSEFVPRIGARVAAGQTLAILEHRYVVDEAVHLLNERWPILTESLAAKRRMLETAAALEKAQYLYKRDSISNKALQEAEAASAIAQIEDKRWRENLAQHDVQINQRELTTRPIDAPISGTIAAANFTQGQIVYEGDKLFTIADASIVWVRLDVPERFAEHAASGLSRAQMSAVSLPGETFSGKFVKAAGVVDAATRTVPFFFEVPNREKRLKIGAGVSARLNPSASPASAAADAGEPRRTHPANNLVHANGVIEADPRLQAQVVAPMWGRIEFAHRPLAVGDHVAKGEELARLVLELSAGERYAMDTRRAEIARALDESKKRKEQDNFEYRRAITLFRTDLNDAFFKQQVESTETIYRAADDEERLLTRQAADFENVVKRRDPKVTVVTAPIAGTITEVAFTPGQLDETQQFRRLFTIADLSSVWIVANVYEKDIEPIRTCRSASFTPTGGTARPLGEPIVIADALDEKTRTLRVIFHVSNPSGSLRLGTFAALAFDVE